MATNEAIIKQLLRNDVMLQKGMTNLVVSMNGLTRRIDNLVGIFEEAAKNVTSFGDETELKPLLERLDSLTDQNKVIAKGLIALEQFMRERQGRVPSMRPRPLPRY